MKKYASSLLLFIWALGAQAKAVTSTQVRTQYAGEIGMFAVGLGAEFDHWITLDGYYGLVPAEVGGDKIETIALKNNYKIYTFKVYKSLLSPYAGLGIYHVLGGKYQTSRDGDYPTNYYQEASVRGLFYLGMELTAAQARENSVYFEMGMNDIWIENYYNNSDVLDPKDYVSLALGWTYHFR